MAKDKLKTSTSAKAYRIALKDVLAGVLGIALGACVAPLNIDTAIAGFGMGIAAYMVYKGCSYRNRKRAESCNCD